MISCDSEDFSHEQSIEKDTEQDIEIVKLPHTKSSVDSDQDVYIVKFKNNEVLNNTLDKLKGMSISEKEEWQKSLGNLKTLYSIYDQAMVEADSLDFSTEEQYKEFKTKYSGALYFPEYKDDFGAYLPILNIDEAFICNEQSEILVGSTLKSYNKIERYEDLQASGQALYEADNAPQTNNLLKSTDSVQTKSTLNEIGQTDSDFREEPYLFKEQYVSNWSEKKGRRVRIKFGRRIELHNYTAGQEYKPSYYTVELESEVTFRKKAIGAWINYKSNTEAKYDIKIISSDLYQVGGMNFGGDFIWTIKGRGSSSHNGYINSPVGLLANKEQKTSEYYNSDKNSIYYKKKVAKYIELYRYYFPKLEIKGSVWFQGTGTSYDYSFTMDHHIATHTYKIETNYIHFYPTLKSRIEVIN